MTTIRDALRELSQLDGVVGSAFVDSETGLCLDMISTGELDLEASAALHAQIMRIKLDHLEPLKIRGPVEDIVITLEHHLYVMRLVPGQAQMFLYLAARRADCNVALARHSVATIARLLDPSQFVSTQQLPKSVAQLAYSSLRSKTVSDD